MKATKHEMAESDTKKEASGSGRQNFHTFL